jgi:hypothetical protein
MYLEPLIPKWLSSLKNSLPSFAIEQVLPSQKSGINSIRFIGTTFSAS